VITDAEVQRSGDALQGPNRDGGAPVLVKAMTSVRSISVIASPEITRTARRIEQVRSVLDRTGGAQGRLLDCVLDLDSPLLASSEVVFESPQA